MSSRDERSIIDLILLDRRILKKVKDISMIRWHSISNDLYLVLTTIKIRGEIM